MSPTGREIKGNRWETMRNHWIWEYSMFRKFHMENDGETMVDAGVLVGIPGLRTFVTYPNSIKWIQIMVLLRHLLSLNLLRAWTLFLLAFWILFSGLAKHVWTARVAAAGICSTIQERGKHIWDQDPRGYKHHSSGPGFRCLEPKGRHKKPMRNDRTEVCHLCGVRLLKGIHGWDGTAFAACNYEGSNKKQINNVNNKIILHSFSVMMSNAICTGAWTSTVYPWPDWRFQPYGGKKWQRWELVRTIIPGSIDYICLYEDIRAYHKESRGLYTKPVPSQWYEPVTHFKRWTSYWCLFSAVSAHLKRALLGYQKKTSTIRLHLIQTSQELKTTSRIFSILLLLMTSVVTCCNYTIPESLLQQICKYYLVVKSPPLIIGLPRHPKGAPHRPPT